MLPLNQHDHFTFTVKESFRKILLMLNRFWLIICCLVQGSFLAGGETQINTVPQFIGSVEKVLQSVTVQPPSEGVEYFPLNQQLQEPAWTLVNGIF